MDKINHSTKKENRKKNQTKKTIDKESPSTDESMTNGQFLMPSYYTQISNTTDECDDRAPTKINCLKPNTNGGIKTKTVTKTKHQNIQVQLHQNTDDDSENSSEEKGEIGSARKERKPLPLIFVDNDSSSEGSVADLKETGPCKCVYLGEKETLRSFWDKCLYECFKSKRCVAGEKPKRKYRKKPKIPKPPAKKRKQQALPLSCIDTIGTAVTYDDYLSRYEMLLFMDPLANSMTPWQKKDFEMAFRLVKPADIFALSKDNNNDDGESTDYTNSDTDQEFYD